MSLLPLLSILALLCRAAEPPTIADRGRPEERAVIERALSALKKSPTAARLETRRDFGYLVSFSSDVAHKGGWGRADSGALPARILLSEGLIRSTGTIVAETLAHELYGHVLLGREVRSRGIETFLHLEENEAYSLAVGAAAACELGGVPAGETAADLGTGMDAYHQVILFLDSEQRRLSLSRGEALTPRKSVEARLAELARRRGSLEYVRSKNRHWFWFASHLMLAHGIEQERLKGVLDELRSWRDVHLPERRRLLDAAEAHLKEVLDWLPSADGRRFAADVRRAAAHPYAEEVEREILRLAEKIPACLARASAAAGRAPEGGGAMGWDELQRIYNEDRRREPDHFAGAPEIGPEIPWRIPVARAKLSKG
ncbi:MAG: hypothetical protein ABIJ96_09525 [Elusimicrobiota bacterium]